MEFSKTPSFLPLAAHARFWVRFSLPSCLVFSCLWSFAGDLKLDLSVGDELEFSSARRVSSSNSVAAIGSRATWEDSSTYAAQYKLKVRAIRPDASLEVEVQYRSVTVWKKDQDWSRDAATLLQAKIVALVSPGGFVYSVEGFPTLIKKERILLEKPIKSSVVESPVEVVVLWTDLEAIFGHGFAGAANAGRTVDVTTGSQPAGKAGSAWSPRVTRKDGRDPNPSFSAGAPLSFRFNDVNKLADKELAAFDVFKQEHRQLASDSIGNAAYRLGDGALETLGYRMRSQRKDPGAGSTSIVDVSLEILRTKSATKAQVASGAVEPTAPGQPQKAQRPRRIQDCPDNLDLTRYGELPKASREKLAKAILATQEFPDLLRWDEQLVEARRALMTLSDSKTMKGCALPEYHLGRSYRNTLLFEASEKWLTRAMEKDPTLYEAMAALAEARILRKDFKTALELSEKALLTCPTHFGALEAKLRALIRLDRLEEARQFLGEKRSATPEVKWKYYDERISVALEGPRWDHVHTAESENYEVFTPVSPVFATEVAEQVEMAHGLYEKIFPEIERQKKKFRIIVHADETEYKAHGGPPQSEGYYDPNFRELVLYKKANSRQTFEVLCHEAFHQFLHDYLELAPPWFNEGFGDYFGAYDFFKGNDGRPKAVTRVNAGRLKDVQTALAENLCPPVKYLMRIPQSQMVDSRWGAVYYAQAWSVIYFIIHGDESRKAGGLAYKSPYKDLLKAYFRLLMAGKNLHEAYMKTFQNVDMDAFDQEWRKFMGTLEGSNDPPQVKRRTKR